MRRPLYGWLTAEALSLTGTRVSMVAFPLFVLETTGSATKAGLVALAEMAPMVVLKVLGGPVIDRLGARRVAITCDVASVVVVGAIPLLHALGLLGFPVFLLLVALAGALRGPGDAAKYSLVPRLVDEAGIAMERATGLGATVERMSGLLGAALAGILVTAVGASNTVVVTAVGFGLSAAVLAWATVSLGGRSTAAHTVGKDDGPYLVQLKEGWDFLRHDPVLVGICAMVALTNLLDTAYFSVLAPVWAVQSPGGAGRLGLVLAFFSGASALGAVVAAAYAARLPRYWTYLVAFLLCGAPRFVVLALESPLAVVLGVGVVAGFAAGFINPVLSAVIFERIPAHLVGRVSSLNTALCFALMPFGGLVAGVLIGGFGLGAALLTCGAAYLVVTMLPALDPRWRSLDRPRQQVPASR